tara:strand:+ start:1469 stop:2128 length:660 start_codon:yes stop_codon:yes gene_type:complete
MKKTFLGLIFLFILLTTYIPNFKFLNISEINIKEIKIENNDILTSEELLKNLNFLYKKNLFFLDKNTIEESLKNETFIESFTLKKIYPRTLIIKIYEKEPVAILQNKRSKFYFSKKGKLINFREIKKFKDLPLVFGNKDSFYSLYQNLLEINFPILTIKSFYFFESGRWDLVIQGDKVLKLPIKDYLISLKNFMELKENKNFKNYKIFDYRIVDQLILN